MPPSLIHPSPTFGHSSSRRHDTEFVPYRNLLIEVGNEPCKRRLIQPLEHSAEPRVRVFIGGEIGAVSLSQGPDDRIPILAGYPVIIIAMHLIEAKFVHFGFLHIRPSREALGVE
jgi:hypothetical protein